MKLEESLLLVAFYYWVELEKERSSSHTNSSLPSRKRLYALTRTGL
jgi:hypothetical protein